ncbi:PTS sugar transporter subunit IIB [Haloimpatiens sp. FM7315]|uniref:PTS sugar transporter subunit IIB n=1 Tax=Haloimpatiens sp. FM7315 TaxID=3298609 RepID=UPI0035A3C89E
MKKVLIACGAGIATSTVALHKLKAQLEERGLISQVSLSQCTVIELAGKAEDYDLVITTTNFSQKLPVPIVKGLSFITGIGMNKTVEEVISLLDLK